ncbi:ribonuclease J [Bacillus sp. CGMCC 1.16607]|uniref:ribonuclease J n=1 Tax=Bacillus sp. CGMCC 1.16607 TaxID=3351842 RepID=UPI0036377352
MDIRKNEAIKLIALGGVGEIGKNMYVVEVDEDIFVIDAGLMLPENEMLGIDIVIPDITYLVENKERIKGIFLTHGHEDHIGALSYVLRKIEIPVYGTRLTLALAIEKMKEQEFDGPYIFNEINSHSKLDFGTAQVSFFRTNHSIPDSIGVCVHTSEGIVVYTGDFKFDHAASKMYQPEIGKMAQIGEMGVLCLISDSTEAERPGYTTSETIVKMEISNAFYNADDRIIAACSASDLNRIQHILDAAAEHNRKVIVVGKNLERIYNIAVELGYLEIHDDLILPMSQMEQYPNEQIVVLMTGMQGEPIEALQKMAKQVHKQINIQKGDSVLIAATPLKGNEVFLYKTIDMLYRAGANVISSKKTLQVSSHGGQEELKFMINLMKPKYFIPVHGEYRMLYAHAKIAQHIGLQASNILIPEKGEVIEIKNDSMTYNGKVPSGNILIDGIGVGDVGNIVLRDRKLLSQDGILIVVVTLKKSEKKMVVGPEIISRGFVYVRESEKLIDDSISLVREVVEIQLQRDSFDWGGIKQEIRDSLYQFLFEKTKRKPMILPIIMEV